MPTLLSFILSVLLAASMMWPSEGALNGSGLHLAVLWLFAGGVAVWLPGADRASRAASLRGCAAWVLLIAGFWISTYVVFQSQGDRRAALNLGFEWTAIGAVWWAVRRCAVSPGMARQMALLVFGLCFGASLQGIVQHHVTYAEQAEWYRQGRAALDAASSANDMQTSLAARKAASEFQAMDIPLSGPGRQLFERRLLSSSEPVGPFALANTLAGMLALALVIMVGAGLQEIRNEERFPWGKLLRLLPFLVTIAYCLVLTKSRTAWVAAAVGMTVLLFAGGLSSRLISRLVPGGVVFFAAVIGVGIGTGALDREVVLESPRSLQFRLLYWIGAAGVIQENPVFGAGPGNFRQHYLAHKPVESSEEILDPHNIFLDAWCAAGVLGLAGVCLLSWQFVCAAFSKLSMGLQSAGAAQAAARPGRTMAGIAVATLLHLLWRWVNGGPFWDLSPSGFATSQNLILLVPLGGIAAVAVFNRALRVSREVIAAAGLTLLVHLTGAGGLQITIVGTVLACLSAVLCSWDDVSTGESLSSDVPSLTWPRVIGGCVPLAGICGVLMFGLIPVMAAEHHLRRAQAHENRGNFAAALAPLQAGLESDPLSVTLRQRRVELLTYQLAGAVSAHARGETTEEMPVEALFDSAVLAATDLIAADHRNWRGYVARSQLRKIVAETGVMPDQAASAVDDLRQATQYYPTNAELWFMLAEVSGAAGLEQQAENAANRALAIEKSNQNWGHVDRFLSDDQLRILKRWH